jgi:RNA polymerase sigma-70 factor, ECF subfamily
LWALYIKGANGDATAQRTLLVALGPALLRVIRAVLGSKHPDVEDALQEAMVGIHGALAGFRGESTITHFACRIALKTALKVRRYAAYRKQTTLAGKGAHIEELAIAFAPDSSEALAATERREILRELLCELPTAQAEVLGLHTMLGYSIEQTAAVTGAPVNTVRSRLRNALAALRDRVNADETLLELLRGGA